MRYQEDLNSRRQKTEWWSPGAGRRREWRVSAERGECQFCKMEEFGGRVPAMVAKQGERT